MILFTVLIITILLCIGILVKDKKEKFDTVYNLMSELGDKEREGRLQVERESMEEEPSNFEGEDLRFAEPKRKSIRSIFGLGSDPSENRYRYKRNKGQIRTLGQRG